MAGFAINPPNTAIAGPDGSLKPEWYRFFVAIQKTIGAANNPLATGQFLTLAPQPALESARTFSPISGELAGTDGGPGLSYTLGLADTTVTPGTYGSASKTVSVVVDAKGRITGAQEFALSTSNVAEGTNLYYTNARARAALSASAGISYDSATGAFTLDNASSRNVDHSAVSITAGTGLTGGGNITASRTISVVAAGTYGAPTGTVSRSSFATYTAASISSPPTQIQVQAIANALQTVSRTLAALITDLQANGNLA